MPVAHRLVLASRELSLARTLEEVQAIVPRAARELTGADGATFVIRDGEYCVFASEDAIEPLWKGSRLPLSSTISGWVMINRRTAAIADIYVDSRIPRQVYHRTFVRSLLVVPIRRANAVGTIGVYWAERHEPTEQEVAVLEALADCASLAMECADAEAFRTPSPARASSASERCRNLYAFIRLRLGRDLSDRELARRWGMNWRSFLNLKEGARRVPRLEELEALADLLGMDASLVVLVARGEPADVVNRWLLDGDAAIREGVLARLGLSVSYSHSSLLHSRIDRIPGGLLTIDLRGCVHDCNARLAAMLAEPERLSIGTHFISLVAPESAAAFLKLEAQALEHGEAGPEPVHLDRGARVVVTLVRVDDGDGRTVGFQGLLQRLQA